MWNVGPGSIHNLQTVAWCTVSQIEHAEVSDHCTCNTQGWNSPLTRHKLAEAGQGEWVMQRKHLNLETLSMRKCDCGMLYTIWMKQICVQLRAAAQWEAEITTHWSKQLWWGGPGMYWNTTRLVMLISPFGWNISVVNRTLGGLSGYRSVNVTLREKIPPASGKHGALLASGSCTWTVLQIGGVFGWGFQSCLKVCKLAASVVVVLSATPWLWATAAPVQAITKDQQCHSVAAWWSWSDNAPWNCVPDASTSGCNKETGVETRSYLTR